MLCIKSFEPDEAKEITEKLLKMNGNIRQTVHNGHTVKLEITDGWAIQGYYQPDTETIIIASWVAENIDLFRYVLQHEVGHHLIGPENWGSQLVHDMHDIITRTSNIQWKMDKVKPRSKAGALGYGLGMQLLGFSTLTVLIGKSLIGAVSETLDTRKGD